ncbi:hypothetical protein N500_0170 [Wolbachia pipientis wUni]|nr:hypothetical protein N500_0170 [Wolbachia pipientis wUni]
MELAREVINLHKAPSSRAIVSYILLRKMFCFIYNQSLSTGFSSGEYGGRYIMSIFLGYL